MNIFVIFLLVIIAINNSIQLFCMAPEPLARCTAFCVRTPQELVNCGNNCYFNATLQALYAIDSLRETFINFFKSTNKNPFTLPAPLSKTIEDLTTALKTKKKAEMNKSILGSEIYELGKKLAKEGSPEQRKILEEEITKKKAEREQLNKDTANANKTIQQFINYYTDLLPHYFFDFVIHYMQQDREEKRRVLLRYSEFVVSLKTGQKVGAQEDAGEFLITLINSIYKQTRIMPDDNPIKNSLIHFFPGTKTTIKGGSSAITQEEIYFDLAFNDVRNSFENAIFNRFNTETQEVRLITPFPFTIFSINRFTYQETPTGKLIQQRLGDPVNVPFDLDLAIIIEDKAQNSYPYRLKAVIEQKGTITGGHYVAYVRMGKQWYLCNDEEIHPYKANEMRALKNNIDKSYVFLYEYTRATISTIPQFPMQTQLQNSLNQLINVLGDIKKALQ